MDRRSFIAALVAASIVRPEIAGAESEEVGNSIFKGGENAIDGLYRRYVNVSDFGFTIGLCVDRVVDGERHRHAVTLPVKAWDSFTDDQKEETWRRISHRLDDVVCSAREKAA